MRDLTVVRQKPQVQLVGGHIGKRYWHWKKVADHKKKSLEDEFKSMKIQNAFINNCKYLNSETIQDLLQP